MTEYCVELASLFLRRRKPSLGSFLLYFMMISTRSRDDCRLTQVGVVGVHALAGHGEDVLTPRDVRRARRAAQHALLVTNTNTLSELLFIIF